MIPPHTSCRYAIIYPADYPNKPLAQAGGLRLVAVHGVDPERLGILCSLVTIGSEHPTNYSGPAIIAGSRILTFAQNLERAQVALRWHEGNTK